jgi:hypothetical protein
LTGLFKPETQLVAGNSTNAPSSIVRSTPLSGLTPQASDIGITFAPVGPTSKRSTSAG